MIKLIADIYCAVFTALAATVLITLVATAVAAVSTMEDGRFSATLLPHETTSGTTPSGLPHSNGADQHAGGNATEVMVILGLGLLVWLAFCTTFGTIAVLIDIRHCLRSILDAQTPCESRTRRHTDTRMQTPQIGDLDAMED